MSQFRQSGRDRAGARSLKSSRFSTQPAKSIVTPTQHRALRNALLASSALAGGILMVAASPQDAFAACSSVGTNPRVVTCANTTTLNITNTNFGVNPSVSRHQNLTTGGNVIVTVPATITINGFGQAITQNQAGTNIDYTNNGTVWLSAGIPSAGGTAALNLTNTGGGNITYSGSGIVSNSTTPGVGPGFDTNALEIATTTGGGITVSGVNGALFQGHSGVVMRSVDGNINADLSGSEVITVFGTGTGYGIYGEATGTGNVDITMNTGSVHHLAIAANALTKTGIAAITNTGNATVTSGVNIGTDTLIYGTGIQATVNGAGGIATVNMTGGTIWANDFGINASSDSGGVVIGADGTIHSVNGVGINAATTGGGTVGITLGTNSHIEAGGIGVQVNASGAVNFVNLGSNTILAGSDGVNITSAAAVDVINNGKIGEDTTTRVGGTGIFINATGAASAVTVSDDASGAPYNAGIGGAIYATTNGIQVADGTTVGITLKNSTVDALNNAIHVRGGNGATTITLGVNGVSSTDLTAGNNAIDVVRNGTASPISVTTFGGTITAGNNGMNLVRTSGSSGGIAVEMHGTDLTGGNTGIDIARTFGTGSVDVTLDNRSSVTGTADEGINIFRTFGTGASGVNVTVDRGSSVSGGDNGINVFHTLGSGGVTMKLDRGGSVIAFNNGMNIFQAFSSGGTTVLVDRGGSVESTGGGTGVNIFQAFSSDGVNVLLDRGGSVTTGGVGVSIASAVSSGDVNVTLDRGGSVDTGGDGIDIFRFGGTGGINVTLDRGGSVLSVGGDGIDIFRFGGTGGINVTLDRGGWVWSWSGDGLNLARSGGDLGIAVSLDRGAWIVADSGSAIRATTSGGTAKDIDITNDSYLRGNGGAGNSTIVASANGNFSFTNNANGWIEGSNLSPADSIIQAEGQTVTIWNDGTMVGNVQLTSGAGGTLLTNNSSNSWYVGGLNTFTSATFNQIDNTATGTIYTDIDTTFRMIAPDANTVNNDGRIFVNWIGFSPAGPGTTTFEGAVDAGELAAGNYNLAFNNTGLLDLRNGISGFGFGNFVPGYGSERGDWLVINGDFNAAGPSTLAIDSRLAGTTNSASDMMTVSGTVTGTTGIVVVNGNNPGQYNPVGIPVVQVLGTTTFTNFYIDPTSTYYTVKNGQGVIDKGMFFYAHDLVPSLTNPGGRDHVLKGLPDEEAFQFAYAAAGAQNVFYETANNWIDKQNDLRNTYMRGQMPNPAGAGADMAVKAPLKAAEPASGFGIWTKGLGSWTDRKDSQSVATLSSTYTFDTRYKQDTYGFLGGLDWTSNTAVSTAQIGAFGGYVDSKLRFSSATAPTNFNYSGAIVGASATYMHGGFFVDALFKADLLKLDISMPSIAPFGASTASVDVTNLGVMGNVGYRHWIGTSYIEGIGTLAYVSTKIDNTSLQGIGINWADGKSFRGAVGGRLGTIMTSTATHIVDVSVLGRVWNEFEGDNHATILSAGPALEVTDGAMKNKPFGEVMGMIDLINRSVGWSGFVNGGAKFNNDFTTYSAKGGLRYQW
jgi:hypothetical protein